MGAREGGKAGGVKVKRIGGRGGTGGKEGNEDEGDRGKRGWRERLKGVEAREGGENRMKR